ncbi:Panacea domain-containing protein [Dinoroseobacter sp. S124A]|uniref:Panacea domain-containing protein n=1 Tax=Dinoroseobacter sp. S124A TaxID=3415128 RepID=UPI003C7A5D68
MPYKPTWVANSFLNSAREEGVGDIDQLKIQKLVYCLHGWNLATQGEAVVGELYEAWPYGPVLSSLYHEFKHAGKSPISRYADDIDPKTGDKKALMVAKTDKRFYEVFQRVWDRYKGYSGIQLSMLTHAAGTPWSNARERGDDYISDEEIREHFLALARGKSE